MYCVQLCGRGRGAFCHREIEMARRTRCEPTTESAPAPTCSSIRVQSCRTAPARKSRCNVKLRPHSQGHDGGHSLERFQQGDPAQQPERQRGAAEAAGQQDKQRTQVGPAGGRAAGEGCDCVTAGGALPASLPPLCWPCARFALCRFAGASSMMR